MLNIIIIKFVRAPFLIRGSIFPPNVNGMTMPGLVMHIIDVFLFNNFFRVMGLD